MATVIHPVLLIAGLLSAAVPLIILMKGYKVFWWYLAFLLLGYLLMGKGFAYVGVAPVYVAEVALALAAAAAVTMLLANRLKNIRPFFRLEIILLLVFAAWQALCTVPYFGLYGVDTIRDAALWGYAAFALFIVLLVPRQAVSNLFGIYGRVLPYLLVWLLVAWVFVKVNPLEIYFPGSPVPLVHLKSGDVGVHLAGAAAFMLLRLDLRVSRWSTAKVWLLWGLWLANWAAWGMTNRAGMLTALLGIGVVLMWRPMTRWYRPAVLGALLLSLLFITNFSSGTFGDQHNRVSISGEQITDNVMSVFGKGSSRNLDRTKQWRLNWWEDIASYTFGGEYFWMGKGYGINLASDDGYQEMEDDSLRAPHNVFMTILARSGVPGLVLWLFFLGAFGSTLLRRAAPRRDLSSWNSKCALWLLAYWLAFLFNGSFDVFLEGPMGGVWFWSLVGMSLVYFTRTSKNPEIRAERASPARPETMPVLPEPAGTHRARA